MRWLLILGIALYALHVFTAGADNITHPINQQEARP